MSGRHLDTLKWLAHDVVKPLLPQGFEVHTPDSRQIGNIMTHVIKACDRAHLVIANTTGNNPNVLYEIAVLDAMGRACIPVKITDDESEAKDLMPFDRAQYRCMTISAAPAKRAETDRVLGEAIQEALAIREAGDMYQNPLTDFFGVPLSSFSSAFGLARGYYYSLVKRAAKALADDKVKVIGSAFKPERYAGKALQIIIPDRLEQASFENVKAIVDTGNVIKAVKIEAPGRPITLYEWVKQGGPDFIWMDIPTTMAQLSGTVLGRRGRDANPDPTLPEFHEIELDEIDQFQRAFSGVMFKDQDAGWVRRMVKPVPWDKTPLP
jgi:hypothetical protein